MVFKLFPLLVHIANMSPLWWGLRLLTFWCPWYPWILCKGPTWPRKKKIKLILFFFIFFILTQKVLIRLLLYLTCKLLLNGGYNVNQDGPSLIIEAPPPPGPPFSRGAGGGGAEGTPYIFHIHMWCQNAPLFDDFFLSLASLKMAIYFK